MAITSEIIGKLGGADLESYPVSVRENRPDTLLRELTVPGGKRYLVAAEGYCPKQAGSPSANPTLYVGDVKSSPSVRYGRFSVMNIVEQDTEVRFDTYASSSINNSSFEGTVYVLEL